MTTNSNQANLKKDTDAGKRKSALDVLIENFHANESTSRFAYKQALQALEEIQKSSETKNHFLEMVISDIIFTALHTTIVEEMFSAVKVHRDVALPLIQKFSESGRDRDRMINLHTRNHLKFLAQNGTCEGCASCEGHADIAPLLMKWHKRDADFFIKLYLEVQTIYCSLERVLYEYLPLHIEFAEEISKDLITQFRTYIAHYVARRLSNA